MNNHCWQGHLPTPVSRWDHIQHAVLSAAHMHLQFIDQALHRKCFNDAYSRYKEAKVLLTIILNMSIRIETEDLYSSYYSCYIERFKELGRIFEYDE